MINVRQIPRHPRQTPVSSSSHLPVARQRPASRTVFIFSSDVAPINHIARVPNCAGGPNWVAGVLMPARRSSMRGFERNLCLNDLHSLSAVGQSIFGCHFYTITTFSRQL